MTISMEIVGITKSHHGRTNQNNQIYLNTLQIYHSIYDKKIFKCKSKSFLKDFRTAKKENEEKAMLQ